jgi:PBP1b-binding outer membrane lipoprotein LpoB
MSRTLRPLAALAMLALIVAGCSNAPAGTDNNTAATHEMAVKFAECMKDLSPKSGRFARAARRHRFSVFKRGQCVASASRA